MEAAEGYDVTVNHGGPTEKRQRKLDQIGYAAWGECRRGGGPVADERDWCRIRTGGNMAE